MLIIYLEHSTNCELCLLCDKYHQPGSTAMFESNIHDWASLAIPQTSLKKPKHAQMCPGVTKAKTAAAMFMVHGHKWMGLCETT